MEGKNTERIFIVLHLSFCVFISLNLGTPKEHLVYPPTLNKQLQKLSCLTKHPLKAWEGSIMMVSLLRTCRLDFSTNSKQQSFPFFP